jgi:hypothetical protein
MSVSNFVVWKDLPLPQEILRFGTCPENMVNIQAQEGEKVANFSGSDGYHYIDVDETGAPYCAERQAMQATIDKTEGTVADTFKISNLPTGASVHLEGTIYPVSGNTASLSFNTSGSYNATCEAFPFKPMSFQIKVTL